MFDQALFDDEEVEVLSIDGGKRIAAALGNRKFCILRNHGLLTVGRSVEESIGWFVKAERVAEVHVKAPNGRPISDEAAALAASTLAPDSRRMTDVPVGPAVARSRSIGGRLNSAPGQLRRRQTEESMIAEANGVKSARQTETTEPRAVYGTRGESDENPKCQNIRLNPNAI